MNDLAKQLAEAVEKIPAEVVPGWSPGAEELPSFFRAENVYNPFYMPNLQAAIEEGNVLRRERNLKTAAELEAEGVKRLLAIIDAQKDFMDYYSFVTTVLQPYGRLPVSGSLDDMFRLCLRIIRAVYASYYTAYISTFDWHPDHPIHGATWWKGAGGVMPVVTLPVKMRLVEASSKTFQCLNLDGSDQGYFRPVFRIPGIEQDDWTVEYGEHLLATGQGDIWVFTSHCRMGSEGAALHPVLDEVLAWAAAAMMFQRANLYKGQIAKVDWFGPFMPCMEVTGHPQGGKQVEYLDSFENARIIDVAGEAEDFCVHYGKEQALQHHADNAEVLEAMRWITDCTSPIVPGADHVVMQNQRAKAAGVQFITHDEPFE